MLLVITLITLLVPPITQTTLAFNAQNADHLAAESLISRVSDSFGLAQAAIAKHDWDGAASHFAQLTKDAPIWLDGWRAWAAVEIQRGRTAEALKIYKDAAEFHKDSPEYALMYCTALVQLETEQFTDKEALPSLADRIKICSTATKLLPHDESAVTALTILLSTHSRRREALVAYRSFLRRHPSVLSMTKSYISLLMKEKRTKEVLDHLEYMIKKSPSPEAYTFAARIAAKLENNSMADEYMEKATAIAVSSITASSPILCPSQSHEELSEMTDFSASWSLALNISAIPGVSIKNLTEEINLVHVPSATLSGHHLTLSSDCQIIPGHFQHNLPFLPTDFPSYDEGVKITNHSTPLKILNILAPGYFSDYWLWMTQTVPRLVIARDLILNNPDYADMHLVIPSEGIKDWVDDMLYTRGFEFLDGRFIFYPNPIDTSAVSTPEAPKPVPGATLLMERIHFPHGLYILDWSFNTTTTTTSTPALTKTPPSALKMTRDYMHSQVRQVYEFYAPHTITSTQLGTLIFLTSTPFRNTHDIILHMQSRFGHRVAFVNGREPVLEVGARFAAGRVVVGVEGDAQFANLVMSQEGVGVIMIAREGTGTGKRERWILGDVFGGDLGVDVVYIRGRDVEKVFEGVSGEEGGEMLSELPISVLERIEDAMDVLFEKVQRRARRVERYRSDAAKAAALKMETSGHAGNNEDGEGHEEL
ncbi:TPR-like protein [Rhizoclosmatium globosum]|uniref:TPR-like protein n=1 Tax=Rhizoclosmatium globosum TaxID=329046 RepID=A0A1Y2AP88_9FUNG|nr:TPR-like protein [Rhizoclosmatium globosum]|eukprot:ORY23765.1 TPR-like protein [Rhizoclosmatium globosum]